MAIGHRIVAGVTVFFLWAATVQGADFTVHPSLGVSEEFTDNVFETRTGKVSDFITRAMPGIALSSKSPALEADLNYVLDYRYYARRSVDDETTHDLSANAHMTLIQNFLFFDVNDRYRRVSLDVTRDVTRESLFVNQEDQNVLTVSPYVTLRPGSKTTVKTGYRFIDTRYFDAPLGVDKTDHSAFLDVSYEISPTWYATGGYTFTREEDRIDDFNQHQPYAGFRYEYADKSFLFGQVGYTWIRYGSGHRLNNIYWSAGASHSFPEATVGLNTGVRYDEDPLQSILQESFVTVDVEKRLKNGSTGLSLYYSEFTQSSMDTLQTRKYGGTARLRYEITERLNGSVAFTAEKYHDQLVNGDTRRLLVDSGLTYLLAEQLTLSLSYLYVDYFSHDIAADNRQVNRAAVELKKVF